jgi:hypothetical protein
MKTRIYEHPLIAFFVLSYAIMYGFMFGYIILQPRQPLQAWSLVWALGIFSPTISGLIISWIIGGWAEVKRLLSGFTRWKVSFWWYFAAAFLLLGPMLIALVYIALGHPAIGLRPGMTISSLLGIVLFQLFSGPSQKKPAGAVLPCRACRPGTMPWFPASSWESSGRSGTCHCFS